jgi:hypothetical protein
MPSRLQYNRGAKAQYNICAEAIQAHQNHEVSAGLGKLQLHVELAFKPAAMYE